MNQFESILKAALFTPTSRGWGLPMLLEGRMGIGKSSRVRALASRYGLPCITVSPALAGEGAFGAVPVPNADGHLDAPPPYWMRGMLGNNPTLPAAVVLVDEIGSAAEHLQPPLLSILVEGMVGGGHMLPRQVRCLGATNPERLSVNGGRLAPNVTCRFGWLNADIEDKALAGELLGNFLTTTASGTEERVTPYVEEEHRVLAAWGKTFASTAGLAKSFFRARPDLVEAYKDGQRSWPNPRSWEWAIRAAASSRIHGLPGDAELAFVGSFVGEGAANEYLQFAATQDIPDPDAILFGDATINWKEKGRVDKVYATVGACVSRLASLIKEPERASEGADRFLNLLVTAPSLFADLVSSSGAQVTAMSFPVDPRLILKIGVVGKNAVMGK